MKRKLVLEFVKMHGAGNDFVVIDNRFYHFDDEELSGLARQLCPRRTAVGADGLLALAPPEEPAPEEPAHHFRMHYVNADGSPATLCGNGARCLARFARSAGLAADPLLFESDAGLHRAAVPADPAAPVRLYVPPPRDFSADWTLHAPPDDQPAHYIWTGTEHVVRFVEAVEGAEVERLGRTLRRDASLAPAGANVNFVQVAREGSRTEEAALRVRTFEKGVEAETPACGTGALAAAETAHRLGRVQGRVQGRVVRVEMPGGTLRVGWEARTADDSGGEALYLEGPAVTSFRGTVEV